MVRLAALLRCGTVVSLTRGRRIVAAAVRRLRPVGRSGRNSVSVGCRADEGSGTRATGCPLDTMRHCAHWHLFRSVQNIPHDGIGEPHRPDQAAVSLPASLCIVAHKSTHSRTHIRVRTTRARTELSSRCAEPTLGLDRVQPREFGRFVSGTPKRRNGAPTGRGWSHCSGNSRQWAIIARRPAKQKRIEEGTLT